jgi:hypothetical protein
MEKALIVLAVLVALDALTTYALTFKYPVHLEFNPILRTLLYIRKELVFAYAPVEFLALLLLFKLHRMLLRRIGIKKRIEYVLILLPLVAVVSNVIGLIL